MANLLNIVESNEPIPMLEVPAEIQSRWEAVTTEQDHGKWLRSQAPQRRTYGSQTDVVEWVDKVVSETDQAVEDLVWDTYLKEDQLPVPMKDRAPVLLNQLRETPRAKLPDLMEVTRRLGFVVLPWEYLASASYESESRGMQNAIETFGGLDSRMDVYVICPPTYYSLENHIKADNPNKQMYAGKNDQAFMALKLTLPTLRAMQAQIETLKANQDTIQRDQYNMRQAVETLARGQDDLRNQIADLKKNVQIQLDQMQEMLAAELRSATEAAVAEAQTILNTKRASKADKDKAQQIMDSLGSLNLRDTKDALAALQEVTFDLLEPLMFALKKGTSLRDRNAVAVLGPCWGPDFADIVATAAELKVDKDRRKEAENMLKVWGNIYGRRDVPEDRYGRSSWDRPGRRY